MRTNEIRSSAETAICHRDIPFTVEALKTLENKVTKECWKYLIGKLCLTEKSKRGSNVSVKDIYEQLGGNFGYVHTSLKRLINYANAIDRIQRVLPEIASDILDGEIRLALQDTITLSKMKFPDICNIVKRLANEKISAKVIISEQKKLQQKTERRGRPKKVAEDISRISVKDTPVYNPDAQINGLTYTIPSWINMIERSFSVTDFNKVSANAQCRLMKELDKLGSTTESVISLLSEVNLNGQE